MFIRYSILLFSLILPFVTAYAETTVPIDDKATQEFYKNSQILILKPTVYPYELAGCLLLHKDGQEDVYLNVLPESIKETLKPQSLTNKPYRTMLTKEQVAKVGFLGLLGISTTEKNILEVSISELWKLEGPSFLNHEILKSSVFDIGKIYRIQGYQVKYNQNVQYSHLVTSEYQEKKSNVYSTFIYVDASGKEYVQATNYSLRELISIAPFDILPLIDAWMKKGETLSFKVSKKNIEELMRASIPQSTTVVSLRAASASLKIQKYLMDASQGGFTATTNK